MKKLSGKVKKSVSLNMGLSERQLAVYSLCCLATDEFSKKYYAPDTAKAVLSEKAAKVKTALEASTLGESTDTIARIMSEILGEDVTTKKESNLVSYRQFVCVVPTGNDNDHNYTIGEVAMCKSGKRFWKLNRDTGNEMTATKSLVKPASRDEILAAVKAIYDTTFYC